MRHTAHFRRGRLCRRNVESLIDLHGIAGYDLTVYIFRNINAQRGLAGSRRPDHRKHSRLFLHMLPPMIHGSCDQIYAIPFVFILARVSPFLRVSNRVPTASRRMLTEAPVFFAPSAVAATEPHSSMPQSRYSV